MKQEMLKYYPEIREDRIVVTGTPQFVPYFDENIERTKVEFGKDYYLPSDIKWICFSGDDITTSPHDQIYLEHLAASVIQWNSLKQDKLHIIFRRCPADNSNRYDDVLKQYSNIITAVEPAWRTLDSASGWHTIIPKKEDIAVLVNTVIHSEFVVNVGSTMAHDFGILNKPCIFINYNVNSIDHSWDVKKVYKYIHFNSMKDLNPVIWINCKDQWLGCIESALCHSESIVQDVQEWTKRITLFPFEDANERIINTLLKLTC